MAKNETLQSSARRLPSGKHGLPAAEVAADQRRRILKALAEVMSTKGYGATTVSDIVSHARVSRPTFYEFFASKQACFMDGHARIQERMIDGILAAPTRGTAIERFDELLRRYLTALASDPATSALYLVYVYEAGPEAIRRRLVMQQRFSDEVAKVFKARSKADRFACTTLVAAISTLVTHTLLEQEADALMDLHAPLMDVAQRLQPRPRRTVAT